MSREPSIETMRAVARRHRPRGWKIVWRKPMRRFANMGAKSVVLAECDFDKRTIYTPVIDSRDALFVCLHEFGHANQQRKSCFFAESESDVEREAEQYAIRAMRAAGIAVPKAVLESARDYVAGCIAADEYSPSDEAFRFAGYHDG